MSTKHWAWTSLAALALASACVTEVVPNDASATGTDTGEGTGDTGDTGDTGSPSSCGDGVVDDGEACDDGDDNGAAKPCTHQCQDNVCGDGFALLGVEACDDGNDDDADGCTNACALPSCGDGIVQEGAGEQCDDGNELDGDACSSACMLPAPAKLALGFNHSCVLYNTGEVYCWGQGEYGATGHGVATDIGSGQISVAEAGPVELGGLAVDLVAGGAHTCALLDSGALRCWGYNLQGQLGLGHALDLGDDEVPTTSPAIDLDGASIAALAAGYSHTCVLLDGGGVRCWGAGANGQLGYGSIDHIGDDELPTSVGEVDLGGAAIAIAAGVAHTCAILEAGDVRCWGDGALGYGVDAVIGDDEVPATAGNVELDAPVTQLSLNFIRTCAVFDDGGGLCWGLGSYGALGLPGVTSVGEDDPPLTHGRIELGGDAVAMAAGGAHTCTRLAGGLVRCFGQAASGQLGYGNLDNLGDDETPASVGPVSLGGSVVDLAAGLEHTCALLDSGEVRCWGDNGYGQLGLGPIDMVGDDELPSDVPPVQLR